ncbi:MAG: thiamine diphosphokinase [Eubacteriales bacterium]|nr:thiamine diphosphokinase [Eubacteriales bacterium]
MDTLIISGGNIEVDFALALLKRGFDHVIGVDGGLRFCYEHRIAPTRIVGDFDTLEPEILAWYKGHTDVPVREYNPVKDATDTQIALELALSLGSTDVTIIGGFGTRLDHVLGNIQTMYLAFERGVPCRMLDGRNRVRLLRGRMRLGREEQYGTYVSLIPYTETPAVVTLEGMKYPLHRHPLTALGSAGLGVSNEIVSDEAVITAEGGIVILIESKD